MCCAGCGHLDNTSSTADRRNCTYATNAGFFDTKDGGCIGNLISNRETQQVLILCYNYIVITPTTLVPCFFLQLTGASRVNFGIMNGSYVVGYLTNATLNSNRKFNLSQLITGAGWLVRA